MGTLQYMSPEILEGCVNLSSGRCFLQGDVYSLGLLLWELLVRCSDLCKGIHISSSGYILQLLLNNYLICIVHMDENVFRFIIFRCSCSWTYVALWATTGMQSVPWRSSQFGVGEKTASNDTSSVGKSLPGTQYLGRECSCSSCWDCQI